MEVTHGKAEDPGCRKIVVVVSWHTLTSSLVNRFSGKCVLNEDEPIGMRSVGAGIW